MAVAVMVAAFVLPSSLNLPQVNPSETLEFAPVPPDEGEDAPPVGNASSLGLGSSGAGPSTDGGPGLPPPAAGTPDGLGVSPRSKRCVGNPPRQTEDELSPPCVAHFEGDNFGATAPGVTRNKINVLFYVDGKIYTRTDAGYQDETQWDGEYRDLSKPATDDDTVTIRNLRRWQRYFNDRYQTYGRSVNFWIYFAPRPRSAETRRADAAENWHRLKPFAVLTSGLVDGNQDVYTDAMAQKGVLTFGSPLGIRPEAFYRKFRGLVWSVAPTTERKAAQYTSYICSKVVNQPVSYSGNPAENGKPRRFGWLQSTDPAYPQLLTLAELVKKQVQKCGVRFVAEATFPKANGRIQTVPGTYGRENMAQFQQQNVTTILWPGGFETDNSRAAGQINYLPEWLVLGDGWHEGTNNARYQDQTAWAHARVVTTVHRTDLNRNYCRMSLREADPNVGAGDGGESDGSDSMMGCSFTYYVDIRQLFTGIQVAGPRLTQASIDQGFHAIPGVRSKDPYVPACFYEVGDYTCIKDATTERWVATSGGSETGCWLMVGGGERYLAGGWPKGNATAQDRPNDPCNMFDSPTKLNS